MAESPTPQVKVPTVAELQAKITAIEAAAQPLVKEPKNGYNPHFVLAQLNSYKAKLEDKKAPPTPADLAVIGDVVLKMDVKDNACFRV